MSAKTRINEFVRKRVRRLRLAKGIKLVDLASQLQIPASSYASMETGQCRISLDHLFRITGALGVEITDVWPFEKAGSQVVDNALYLRRIQEFRLSEIISLTEAEGGALFSVQNQKCRVLLYQDLSDFLLDRLILYLEDSRSYPHGIWFEHSDQGAILSLFLKAEECPAYVGQLIRYYMVTWSQLLKERKLIRIPNSRT